MNSYLIFFKKNFLVMLLVLIIVVLTFNQQKSRMGTTRLSVSPEKAVSSIGMAEGGIARDSYYPQPISPVPPTDQKNRLVITDTSLSLVVKNVKDELTKIQDLAKQQGGFLVDSNLTKPEQGGTGTITIRVPADKLSETLEALRGFAVKVVSEHVSGSDVTDQYVDLDARLAVLQQTKAKFETILAEATEVEDMLQVQQQLMSLQDQIDSVKGQQQYLEKSAELSRITVYLSTDELALPYAPDNAWRPGVVFKQAVRSLMGFLRDLGSMLIWVGVFAVIWVPVVLVIYVVRRKRRVV